MDRVQATILGLSTGVEADTKQLLAALPKLDEFIIKGIKQVDDVLVQLDPERHTLGFAWLLASKAAVGLTGSDPMVFVSQAQRLFVEGDRDAFQQVPHKVKIVARRYTDVLTEHKRAIRGVRPLALAIAKTRGGPDTLTALHADFVQLCLLSKCYHAAVPMLEDPVYEIEKHTTAREVMRYFYYGGIVYIGLKQWAKALELFSGVFTVPAMTLSAIMLETYKKWVLVSLLLHGEVAPLPKYTSTLVARGLKSLAAPYGDLANSFGTRNADEVHKIANTHAATVFSADNNLGLVKQCIQSLDRFNIQRCTQTFLTLSLQNISDTVKLQSAKDAEKRVLRMIEDRAVFASINQRDGMVSFQEDPEKYNTVALATKLNAQIKTVFALAAKLQDVDETISSSTQYLQRTALHESRGRPGDVEDGDVDAKGTLAAIMTAMRG